MNDIKSLNFRHDITIMIKVLMLLQLLLLLPTSNSLRCYECSGKKYLCKSSTDPGVVKECPSLFSLIRPHVVRALGMFY